MKICFFLVSNVLIALVHFSLPIDTYMKFNGHYVCWFKWQCMYHDTAFWCKFQHEWGGTFQDKCFSIRWLGRMYHYPVTNGITWYLETETRIYVKVCTPMKLIQDSRNILWWLVSPLLSTCMGPFTYLPAWQDTKNIKDLVWFNAYSTAFTITLDFL